MQGEGVEEVSYRPYTQEMLGNLGDNAVGIGLGVLAHKPAEFTEEERFLLMMEAVRRLTRNTVTGFGDLDFEHGASGPRYGSDENL